MSGLALTFTVSVADATFSLASTCTSVFACSVTLFCTNGARPVKVIRTVYPPAGSSGRMYSPAELETVVRG